MLRLPLEFGEPVPEQTPTNLVARYQRIHVIRVSGEHGGAGIHPPRPFALHPIKKCPALIEQRVGGAGSLREGKAAFKATDLVFKDDVLNDRR